MTTKRTQSIFYTTVVFFVVAVSIIIVVFFQMKGMADSYQEQQVLVQQNAMQEQAHNNLARVVEESQAERTQLREYILTESDTISFLTEIEQLAKTRGILLHTKELSEESIDGSEFENLRISFDVEGSLAQLEGLIRLFESLPYHGKVQRTNLNRQGGSDKFQGSIVLVLSLIAYD